MCQGVLAAEGRRGKGVQVEGSFCQRSILWTGLGGREVALQFEQLPAKEQFQHEKNVALTLPEMDTIP